MGAKQGRKCDFHRCVLFHTVVLFYMRLWWRFFLHREPTEKLVASSKFDSASASFCWALTLSYRPCKHLTQLLFGLLPFLSANAARCVLSACLLLTFCAAFTWERPNRNLQKHTVANCRWSLSCYPPLCTKKSFTSLFDVPAPRCCWVWCSQLFFAFIPCQSSWHQSRVCINECSPVGMKWFCHSRRNAQHSKHSTAKQRSGVFGDMATRESPDVLFTAGSVLGWDLFQPDTVWVSKRLSASVTCATSSWRNVTSLTPLWSSLCSPPSAN